MEKHCELITTHCMVPHGTKMVFTIDLALTS